MKFLHFNNDFSARVSIAFKRKWQNRTVAVEPLDSAKVKGLAEAFLSKDSSQEVFVQLNIGITFVSLKDRYNRQTGREESIKRMKIEQLRVIGIVSNKTHIFVNLENFKGISLNLRSSKESGYATVTGELEGA